MADRGNRARKAGGIITPAQATAAPAVPSPPAAPAAASIETPPKSGNSAASPAVPPLDVHVTLVCGGLTNVKAPVVIGARYDGLAFAGPTKAFDRSLDSWLTRAADLGIIGSALGQLFPINLEQFHEGGKLNAQMLLLAGMGEPGRFAQDSLQFVVSNIVVTIKTMGATEFACSLLGTRRDELSIGDAVRGFVQGIRDGYDRLQAIAEQVTDQKEGLKAFIAQPLSITLVHPDRNKLELMESEFQGLFNGQLPPENPISGKPSENLNLKFARGEDVAPDPQAGPSADDVEPDTPLNYLRVTRSKSAAAGAIRAKSATPKERKKPANRSGFDPFPTEIFQFSALSTVAVVPQRDQEVNRRLMRDLAERMTQAASAGEQAELGTFFTNYVIPYDLQKLIHGPLSVTIEVDETTAVYPWEMAAYEKFAGAHSQFMNFAGSQSPQTNFLSATVAMSRQFRSLLSPPPTSPPPLNNKLKALIIADPAPGDLALSGAREEGFAVVDVLEQARIAWKGRYEVTTTVRIGPQQDDGILERLQDLLKQNKSVESAERCDPLKLAMLLVNRQYDLVHYAGHGMSDPETGQTGWVFARDCILSAKEIFCVRQVPRLVFANACFSAVTSDRNAQQRHMTGLAQAFFGRGIPNFIGAGWQVGDDCAKECARWFYAGIMGLRSPSANDGVSGTAPPATIGEALKRARNVARDNGEDSSSWGAYQHYGRVNDKLVSFANAATTEPPPATNPDAATSFTGSGARPGSAAAQAATGVPQGPTNAAPDRDLVYVNGIDVNTGNYGFAPRSIAELAKEVTARPSVDAFHELRRGKPRSLPFDMDVEKLDQSGWGIIFHEDTPQDIRAALEPLIALRKPKAGERCQMLDYKKGEQVRDWYQRNQIAPGNLNAARVPYYLLLIGPPTLIPFEFQYLLGVEYAVGRLPFEKAADFECYVRSIRAYEGENSVPNARRITYWGTRNRGDRATSLSASFLVDPLANGIPGSVGALKRALGADVKYDSKLFLGNDATKANLLDALHARQGAKPPAMLFTASHGALFASGQDGQTANQGALLCQDWTGIGPVGPQHLLAAADIDDEANVSGLVAMLFACFGAGTPDQSPLDPSQAGTAQPLAPAPFAAALPQRLLTHPKGSALAVIGHVDRAYGFSMQAAKVAEPQIATFRNSMGSILTGKPIGHAMCSQFGARFSALSALLLSATSPTAPKPDDRDLMNNWLERNDAQNYVLLGDPAARVRNDILM